MARRNATARWPSAVVKQQRLHALDPELYSLMIPVDDDDFPDESYTAGWADEEPDSEPGYVQWEGDSDDAADSTTDDITAITKDPG
jgi:hypothetical protein